MARARLFLGEDMEGEARSFRCALHQFGSNNLQPNARLFRDHAFSLDDFRQVPKVGDDGIIQVRQAGKSWTSGFVANSHRSMAVALLEPVRLKARNPCLVLRGGKKARRR